MPLSILNNWANELRTWAPSLEVGTYHGPNRLLPRNSLKQNQHTSSASRSPADVVLTTYHILRDDYQILMQKTRFGAMILDESQAIKNRSAQITRAVIDVAEESVGPIRIALTGTPVENTLSELYSIFSHSSMIQLFFLYQLERSAYIILSCLCRESFSTLVETI